MCGICGFAGLADEALARRMADSIAHRGPDGSGTQAFEAVDGLPPATLGHRRLTIIDLTERGRQPMSYGDGRYWITFNGEIYNFRELRAELERDGFRFASNCDTEVLLALYARDGREMLSKLNGMFAFGIWDAVRGELFLARDRLGVKPLYWVQAEGILYFASEVKALLQAPIPARLRPDAVLDCLTFLWVPDPDTLFDGVSKLPPGHYATFADGRLDIQQYWDMSYAPEEASEDEWAERVRSTLMTAVQRQTVSDVPLGSFLSGGIDSSAIVAALSRQEERPTTYTIGFSAEDLAGDTFPDDVRYSRQIAEEFDVEYNERILSADIVDLLPKLIWHMDEPVADPAAITSYLICAAAKEKLTVILSGMGGDEIFAGYPRYPAARLGSAVDWMPVGLRGAVRRGLDGRLTLGPPGRMRGPRRNAMKWLRGIDLSPEERYLTYISYYRPEELPALLGPDLNDLLSRHDPYRYHRRHVEHVQGEHWLNRLLYLDMKTYMHCHNLTYTDKMSMAASTEVRVPFLDDEVVELSGRVPPDLKMRRLTRKYVLKKSMEGVLPHDVIYRPKAGFGAPIRSWLVGDLKPMVDDLLSPSAVAARGLFDPQGVEQMIRDNESGHADNALRIWTLLTLELWHQAFVDGGARGGLAATGSAA